MRCPECACKAKEGNYSIYITDDGRPMRDESEPFECRCLECGYEFTVTQVGNHIRIDE